MEQARAGEGVPSTFLAAYHSHGWVHVTTSTQELMPAAQDHVAVRLACTASGEHDASATLPVIGWHGTIRSCKPPQKRPVHRVKFSTGLSRASRLAMRGASRRIRAWQPRGASPRACPWPSSSWRPLPSCRTPASTGVRSMPFAVTYNILMQGLPRGETAKEGLTLL